MNLNALKNLKNNIDKSSLDMSNVYEVYQGGFGINPNTIPTYICSSTIKQLTEDLITFEKLLKVKKWPVSKILQREVNKKRVEEISRKFIQGSEKVKYFPPIVVALLPRNEDNMAEEYKLVEENEYLNSAIEKIFANSNFSTNSESRDLIISSEKISNAEGLFILKPFPVNFQLFSWDKSKFFAIVIDGQHRFESLKKAAEDPTSNYNLWKQDVIFIDGSSLSMNLQNNDYLPINFFRKIFIDINKHPVQVSKAKQIIMDDNDVASLFVQSIVDDDQSEESKYLKPELIDWHTSASKHELPYLTSVLNLHSIFQEKLLNGKNLSSIADLVNPQKVKEWVDRLNDYFFVDETIESKKLQIKKLKDSLDEYKDIWNDDEFELFNFDRQILSIAQNNFADIYRESFVKLFNEFRAYSLLISFLNDKNIFDRSNDLSDILLKSSENREKSEDILFNKLKRECDEYICPNYSIILSVVGQKSLIDIFYNYITSNRGAQITNERHLQLTNEFLEEINNVFVLIENGSSKLFGKNETNTHYTDFVKQNFTTLSVEYPGLSNTFWSEMLFYGTAIKYNTIGIRAITKTINYCLLCNKQSSIDDINKLANIENKEFKTRIKNLAQNDYGKSEEIAEEVSEQFIILKSNYLKSIFIEKLA
jgi:hypothetical protein